MVQIEIQDGPDAGKTFELAAGLHTVGRATTNDVVVASNSVSGSHLSITVSADDSVSFEDLGSTNGSYSGGMKVSQGAWFPGSELKLGDVSLKLIDDTEAHKRLRSEALEKPKSSVLTKVAALVIIGGGATFAYLQYFAPSDDPIARSNNEGAQGVSSKVSYDLIDNLGDFADSEDWQLIKGATITDGTLRAVNGAAQASLSRLITLDGASLEISAKVSGNAYLEISWGANADQEKALASWNSPALGSVQTMSLPPLADWMKVSVQLAAGASVQELRINQTDAAAASASTSMGKVYFDGGNLAIVANGSMAFSLSSSGGQWQVDAQGARLLELSAARVLMQIAPDFLNADSRLQVMADGGPIVPSATMTIADPAGLLCGTDIDRYFFDFDGATSISGNLTRLRVNDASQFSFVWDMREPLTEAAREMQVINASLSSGNDSALLAACERLLRKYPLKDANVTRALLLARETMARGQRELSDLQQQASGALFVGASTVMLTLNESALALSLRFEDTDIAVQAIALSELLLDVVAQDATEIASQQQGYYARVVDALDPVYPQISAWLKEAK
jgi:pSer/pThr/pTyr-binding forkhead associated (FHA) protein